MADSSSLGKEGENVVLTSTSEGRILNREDTPKSHSTGVRLSALCRRENSDRKHSFSLVISAIFALSFIGSIYFCLTDTFKIASPSLVQTNNSSFSYSMWRRPMVQPLMKVHIFNYTNWKRVRDGLDTRLNVDDVGPYVYSQKMERVNMKVSGDQLTYQKKSLYEYRSELSVGHHYDQVEVPNLPLMAIVAKGSQLHYFPQLAIRGAIESLANHINAFLRLPVKEFLWGYDDKLVDIIKPVLNLGSKKTFDRYGLLVMMNGTLSDPFTINTGETEKDKMYLIEKVNGEESLPYWNNPECNCIESTDGFMFPTSMLDRNQTLYVYYPNIYRKLPFQYTKDIDIGGGNHLLRYTLPTNVFDSNNPTNQCSGNATWPPSGVMNITVGFGATVLASLPHFHNADPIVWDRLTGLRPNMSMETYLDVHPTLGIVLGGKSSIQMNIQVKKSERITNALSFLGQDQILPIAWVEMSVEEIPENLRSWLYPSIFSSTKAKLALTVFCTFIISSIWLFAVVAMMLVRKRKNSRCITLIRTK